MLVSNLARTFTFLPRVLFLPINLRSIGVLSYTAIGGNRVTYCSRFARSFSSKMLLPTVVERLERFASLKLAGSWDNVGLLVEPTPPHHVRLAICTIDLTEVVMKEAIGKRVDMIISYHPPIFSSLKRITQSDWKQRILTKAFENRIAIYSPHTSLDSVKGGVNDWLLSCFENGNTAPLKTYFGSFSCPEGMYKVELSINGSSECLPDLQSLFKNFDGCLSLETTAADTGIKFVLEIPANSTILTTLLEKINGIQKDGIKVNVFKEEELPNFGYGEGRLLTLRNPLKISDVVEHIKRHLHLHAVRLALGNGCFQNSEISTIAACAGSGSSVLRGVKADLYLSGEMSHHDVLDATARGVSVILCEHSNTERGYLKAYASKIKELCDNEIEVLVSESDRDPLQIV